MSDSVVTGTLSLSNSREKCIPSEDLPGIDRLSLSFPVSSFVRNRDLWSSWAEGSHPAYGPYVRVGGRFPVAPFQSAFIGLTAYDSVPSIWARVEWNPSRVVDPDGCSLASVYQALDTASEVMAGVFDFVENPVLDPERINVTRLDVARDFSSGCFTPERFIRSLANVPRPYARRSSIFSDPKSGRAETLTVGSNSGALRLYDKFVESSGSVDPGTMRLEFQCRKSWLRRYGGISSLADLNGDSVTLLSRNRFDWGGMGAEVDSTGDLWSRLQSTSLSERERVFFLGWLVASRSGSTPNLGSATLAKYRRLQRELGVSLDSSESGPGFVSRLDWESGQVVTHAVA